MSEITELNAKDVSMPFTALTFRDNAYFMDNRGSLFILPPGIYPVSADQLRRIFANYHLVQAGEQLYAGDAIVMRDGLAYRADPLVPPLTQAKAAFGEIASDADRETVDVDDLDALFAKIDEVLEDERDKRRDDWQK